MMEDIFQKEPTEERGNGESERVDTVGLASEDIPYEVAKVLRRKRWKLREEPFRGFGSPPGRF